MEFMIAMWCFTIQHTVRVVTGSIVTSNWWQVEEVQQWKNELLNQRRLTMERRLDRAEQKRHLQLQIIVRKAHEEETKVTFSL